MEGGGGEGRVSKAAPEFGECGLRVKDVIRGSDKEVWRSGHKRLAAMCTITGAHSDGPVHGWSAPVGTYKARWWVSGSVVAHPTR